MIRARGANMWVGLKKRVPDRSAGGCGSVKRGWNGRRGVQTDPKRRRYTTAVPPDPLPWPSYSARPTAGRLASVLPPRHDPPRAAWHLDSLGPQI